MRRHDHEPCATPTDTAGFWLSFCDTRRPRGQRFLGVALVEAPEFKRAIAASWLHGCNPGGEVEGFSIPEAYWALVEPFEKHRLLTREQAACIDERLSSFAPGAA